jgi:redox-sensitive bicupin YhaK (pirin superfamily)
MTAASGLVHEEMHGREFAKRGGRFEMIQLWVNLPAKFKKTNPKYQSIKNENVPRVEIENGFVRVISGNFKGVVGPASTFTPVNLWDMRLKKNSKSTFVVPKNHTAAVFVLSGEIALASGEILGEAEIGFLDTDGDMFSLEAVTDSKVLFLGGEPIHEPVIGYGPFVMNTKEEIQQAFRDYHNGLMGKISVGGV